MLLVKFDLKIKVNTNLAFYGVPYNKFVSFNLNSAEIANLRSAGHIEKLTFSTLSNMTQKLPNNEIPMSF